MLFDPVDEIIGEAFIVFVVQRAKVFTFVLLWTIRG